MCRARRVRTYRRAPPSPFSACRCSSAARDVLIPASPMNRRVRADRRTGAPTSPPLRTSPSWASAAVGAAKPQREPGAKSAQVPTPEARFVLELFMSPPVLASGGATGGGSASCHRRARLPGWAGPLDGFGRRGSGGASSSCAPRGAKRVRGRAPGRSAASRAYPGRDRAWPPLREVGQRDRGCRADGAHTLRPHRGARGFPCLPVIRRLETSVGRAARAGCAREFLRLRVSPGELSGTPWPCSRDQDLFSDPRRLLHRFAIDAAGRQGWPRRDRWQPSRRRTLPALDRARTSFSRRRSPAMLVTIRRPVRPDSRCRPGRSS